MTEGYTLEKVLEGVGGIEGFNDQMDRAERVMRYFWDHSKELTKQYPHMWVAVTESGVVAVSDTLEDTLVKVKLEGLSDPDYVIGYLDPDPPTMFL